MFCFSPFGGVLSIFVIILQIVSTKEPSNNATTLNIAETDIVYDQPEAKTIVKMTGNSTLTPSSLKVLNQILKNLELFSDQRAKELDALNTRQSLLAIGNTSISDQILSLRNSLSSLKPIKKTFGYKVTVYRSPSTVDDKPTIVKEYFDQEDPGNAKDDKNDLTSANSNSHHTVVPAPSYESGIYIPKPGPQLIKRKEEDHGKKSEEHVRASHHHDRGLHKDSARLLEHEEESHRNKHGGHHRESNHRSHDQGEYGHDKSGASQTGVRERTEIEFFEKEHFLDTEHDKAKSGYENRNGHTESDVRDEHLSQQHHKEHGARDSHSSHKKQGGKREETVPILVDSYRHPGKYGNRVVPGAQHEDKHAASSENADRAHHSNQESSKKSGLHGRRHSHHNNEDSSYSDKDKGRTKEGYRERGYKITTEREYFLKDAHHDTGFGKHNNGHLAVHLDKAKHGNEVGERHRDFKKEHAVHDSHDVASDKKEGHRHNAEHHQGDGFVQEEGNGEHYQQPEYIHGSPSGNHPVAQKRDGPQLPTTSKTTKCKTCCRKYIQTTTKAPVRITPRRAKVTDATRIVKYRANSSSSSSIPSAYNKSKAIEKIDGHASAASLEQTRRRNITWPSRIATLTNGKGRRPKGKVIRQKFPTSSANEHRNSSHGNYTSENGGYRSSQIIIHPPSYGKTSNDAHVVTTSADLNSPSTYSVETRLKHPPIEMSINKVRTDLPDTSINPFVRKFPTTTTITTDNKEDYQFKTTVEPKLKHQFSPMPILSLYGGANSGLHYYKPNSDLSISSPIIKTPVSEVKYVDDTDVQTSIGITGFTTPSYDARIYPTNRPDLNARTVYLPKTFAGTYGSPVKEDYLPTYRDSPSGERQSFHSPTFLTTTELPVDVLTDDRGIYKYIISPPAEEEPYVTTVKYSQPLVKTHPDYKRTGVWYPEK